MSTYNICFPGKISRILAAPAAQSDKNLTGDQEVAGSIPTGPATFFCRDQSCNIFYGHSLPSAYSSWQKNVNKYWLMA